MLVNNEKVEDSLVRDEERAIRPHLYEAMQGETPAAIETRVREWARENIVERVVLRQAALADPEPISPEAIDAELRRAQPEGQAALDRNNIEILLRIQRLMDRATANVAPPRNKDVVEHYRKHRQSFQSPERVHAAHIIKNVDERTNEATALAAIQEIHLQLAGGADFEELADKHSDCPGRGGDLGVFAAGQMVPEFDSVVFALQPGEVSEPFRTSFGYHIAKIYEKRLAGVAELNDIRPELEKYLFEHKKSRAAEQFTDRLLAKADVREG